MPAFVIPVGMRFGDIGRRDKPGQGWSIGADRETLGACGNRLTRLGGSEAYRRVQPGALHP